MATFDCWEYMTIDNNSNLNYINDLGKNGWELVCGNEVGGVRELIFKRKAKSYSPALPNDGLSIR